VQVNGKVRARLTVAADSSDDDVRQQALNDPAVLRHLENISVQRVIVIPRRLISIVAR
jgi:leucyl-tRNA synthetase